MRKTIAIPTGSVFAPSGVEGVSRPTSALMSMQTAIPVAPTMRRNLRPKRSTVQAALSVKRIPKVALRALIRLMVSPLLQILGR
ncbi:unnamed protein product [Aspergillus oryzae]|nr:unnamed protein product [Aspergillus oryzae]GMF91610.1 unnamed protein product [Aspergillus oryzae]